MDELESAFEQIDLAHKRLVFIEHHTSHAACAYYQRPWEDETLVLTLDGAGDGISATVNVGRGFSLERIALSPERGFSAAS